MRMPKNGSTFLHLCCLAFLASLAVRPADAVAQPQGGGQQQQTVPASKDKPLPKDAEGRHRVPVETLQGKAGISVHSAKMEKGTIYRVTVKADGFVPQIQIDGQRSGTFPNPGDALNPNADRGSGQVAQMLFTPKQSKEHQITVDHILGRELGKGPLPYALTIERAVPRPHLNVKDSQLA